MNREAFELVKSKVIAEHITIKDAAYHQSSFGSWYITIKTDPDFRLVYDGKENWLLVEQETEEIFNGMSIWSEVWIARDPTDMDLLTGIAKLIDTTK